jgi:hypothetical protein
MPPDRPLAVTPPREADTAKGHAWAGLGLGRIVWWTPAPLFGVPGPLAALVVAVGKNGRCNLQGFLPQGIGHYFQGDTPYDPEGKPGTWRWPERV